MRSSTCEGCGDRWEGGGGEGCRDKCEQAVEQGVREGVKGGVEGGGHAGGHAGEQAGRTCTRPRMWTFACAAERRIIVSRVRAVTGSVRLDPRLAIVWRRLA